MNKSHVTIALLLGIIIGQVIQPASANAQSAADVQNRMAIALEKIATSLANLERKVK